MNLYIESLIEYLKGEWDHVLKISALPLIEWAPII